MQNDKVRQWQRKYDAVCQAYGKEPETLDEIAEAIVATISVTNQRVTGFYWEIEYNPKLGNTHSSPQRGVTNWGQQDNLPKNYPGLWGRVWIRYATPPERWASDTFHPTMTYPGTGGGGAYNGPWEAISRIMYKLDRSRPTCMFSWDYRVWVDDWPCLEEIISKAATWHKLKAKRHLELKHKFGWDDEETAKNDAELLATYPEHWKQAV
jgi:hypothetical protein